MLTSTRERSRSVLARFTTDTARQTLYTCPPNCTSKVYLLYFANGDGIVSVDVEWYRAAMDTHFFIISGKNMAAGEFLKFSEGYIVLEAGDRLEFSLDTTSRIIDAFCTVEETFV